jgi:hypothetical protein
MYHNDGMKKGGTNVALLSDVERALNGLFRVKELGPDPGFSRFVPGVYDPIGFDWKSVFEPEFNQLFNGLMIRGAERVHRVFLAVFPTEEVLEAFLDEISCFCIILLRWNAAIPVESGAGDLYRWMGSGGRVSGRKDYRSTPVTFLWTYIRPSVPMLLSLKLWKRGRRIRFSGIRGERMVGSQRSGNWIRMY